MSDGTTPTPIPAAQYLRMSDEHQRYSLQNQSAAIARYAEQRGFVIVQSYIDAAKSGLYRKGRTALNALLEDVRTRRFEFKALLILDVSRWGRYQNHDEPAHYEFLCWEAGIDVRFCVEPFENDGSAGSSMVKHIKRIMAAEYVRELSERLRRAKKLKAMLGQHTGSRIVFGYRRELLTYDGASRMILQPGERKAITSDRLRIILGPPQEAATVREIYRLFVRDRMSIEGIARHLRRKGRPHPYNGDWTGGRVRRVLTDETYTGALYYGKSWRYLKGPPHPTPRSTWIKVQDVPRIISASLFARARAIFESSTARQSKEEIAERLRRCLADHGRLSAAIIGQCAYAPSLHAIENRFGGLLPAYAYIGYEPSAQAKAKHSGRPWSRWDEEQALEVLRAIYREHGYVNGRLIAKRAGAPSPWCYVRHLGGLPQAYERAGLDMPRNRADLIRAGYYRSARGALGPALRQPIPRKTPIFRNARGERFTDEELLDCLRRLVAAHGYVNERVIQQEHSIPTASYFRQRFGSLIAAYRASGYAADRSDVVRLAAARRAALGQAS